MGNRIALTNIESRAAGRLNRPQTFKIINTWKQAWKPLTLLFVFEIDSATFLVEEFYHGVTEYHILYDYNFTNQLYRYNLIVPIRLLDKSERTLRSNEILCSMGGLSCQA